MLIFCFHWSWKKCHTILGYDPKILLVNQIAGFFYFWLVWLVKLIIPGVHCYIILVNSEEWCFEFQLHCNRTYSQHNYSRILYFTGGENSKECLYGNSKYCRSWWYVYFFFCFCNESQLVWKYQEHFYFIFWTNASIRIIKNLHVE